MLLKAIAAPLLTSGSASGWSRNSCGTKSVAIASVSRATCWVTSTSATARSRVAERMERPSVQTSTTSPVVAPPRCHSTMAQANRRYRQDDRNTGVQQPQLFQIAQAASPRRDFAPDGGVEAVVLVAQAAERPHQRHVVDDVDHFAVDGGGLVGEVVMQRLARRGQAEHRDHHEARDHDQPAPPSAG